MARSPNHLAPAFQSALSLPEAVAATSLQRVLLTDPSVLQASPWPLPSRRLQGRRVFADRQVTTNATRNHSDLCFLPRLLLLLQLSGRESRTCWPPVSPSSGDVLDILITSSRLASPPSRCIHWRLVSPHFSTTRETNLYCGSSIGFESNSLRTHRCSIAAPRIRYASQFSRSLSGCPPSFSDITHDVLCSVGPADALSEPCWTSRSHPHPTGCHSITLRTQSSGRKIRIGHKRCSACHGIAIGALVSTFRGESCDTHSVQGNWVRGPSPRPH